MNYFPFFVIAATPSYFFTPQSGHNFFFSELLRSLVQRRKADELNVAMKSKNVSKKLRKNTFHQKPVEPEWKRQKTHDSQTKVAFDSNENDDPKTASVNCENSQDSVINVDKDDSSPATTIVTNPEINTSSTFNGSCFTPYVDPLHFFIDLRVSAGHKREAYFHQALKNNNILLDSNNWNNPISKNRNLSAFKVPGSLINESSNNFSAINLISNCHQQQSSSPKFYEQHSEVIPHNMKDCKNADSFEVELKNDQERDE